MVVLVPSNDLNPETDLYYGEDEFISRQKGKPISPKQASLFKQKKTCPVRSYEEVMHRIDTHQPKTP